jgi:large subunit ribosomal protein L10
MPNALKHAMAEEVKTKFDASPNLLVVGLLEMNAEQNFELRTRLRSEGVRLRVIHNRTSRFALDEPRQGLAEFFVGQTAVAVGTAETEFIPVAKTLVEAARKKTLELRGGYVDGELFDKAGFVALAKSPDKLTLRAMLAGAISGPARGIAASMNAVGSGLARCLQQRIDEGGGAGEAAEPTAPEAPAAAEATENE